MGEILQAFIDSGWLTKSFAAIALGSTLVIIAVILSENRNPVKSLAWVTVFIASAGCRADTLYLFRPQYQKQTHDFAPQQAQTQKQATNTGHRRTLAQHLTVGTPTNTAGALAHRRALLRQQ